jgi:hypothetical protein
MSALKNLIHANLGPDQFFQIANALLNRFVLQVNDQSFRLTEIEFYLHDGGEVLDPFAHEHDTYATGSLRLHGEGNDKIKIVEVTG